MGRWMLRPHRNRHLRVEWTIDDLELRRNVYSRAHYSRLPQRHRDTEKLQIKSLGRWYLEVNSLCVILFVSLCLCGELFQAIRLVAP